MDERRYLVQALFEFLERGGIPYCSTQLDPGNAGEALEVVVAAELYPEMPREVARFCRAYDLHLVHLAEHEPGATRFVLSWAGEAGELRVLVLDVRGDLLRGARLLLAAGEVLSRCEDGLPAPHMHFIYTLLRRVGAGELSEADGAALSALWHRDPAAAWQQVRRFWRMPADAELLAQAAAANRWSAVGRAMRRLGRGLQAQPWSAAGFADDALRRARLLLQPDRLVVAFTGASAEARSALIERVRQDLAPLWQAQSGGGLVAIDGDPGRRLPRPQLRIEIDDDEFAAARAEALILGCLEQRLERRDPRVRLRENPAAARLLLYFCRRRVPLLSTVVRSVFNSDIRGASRTPILMPHPYGVIIDARAVLGSRVTVMHQVTIGAKDLEGGMAPVIEDDVFIGCGAKVLGPVRVGRGALIGANAVVTRDVAPFSTVVGVNRVVSGVEADAARAQRSSSVGNTPRPSRALAPS